MYVLTKEHHKLDAIIDDKYKVVGVQEFLSLQHVPLETLAKCQFYSIRHMPAILQNGPVYTLILDDVPSEHRHSLSKEKIEELRQLCKYYPTHGDYGSVFYEHLTHTIHFIMGDGDNGTFELRVLNDFTPIGYAIFQVNYDDMFESIRNLGYKVKVHNEHTLLDLQHLFDLPTMSYVEIKVLNDE